MQHAPRTFRLSFERKPRGLTTLTVTAQLVSFYDNEGKFSHGCFHISRFLIKPRVGNQFALSAFMKPFVAGAGPRSGRGGLAGGVAGPGGLRGCWLTRVCRLAPMALPGTGPVKVRADSVIAGRSDPPPPPVLGRYRLLCHLAICVSFCPLRPAPTF